MKLTANIAAAYWGANMMHKGDTYKVFNSLRDGYVNLWDSETCYLEDVNISECQLLLTPLSKISDEDAVEVAKICNRDNNSHKFKSKSKEQLIEMGRLIAYDLVSTYGDPHYVQLDYAREIIDYLSSKGYDCGHGSIPSLIAAGVAVEKKEI